MFIHSVIKNEPKYSQNRQLIQTQKNQKSKTEQKNDAKNRLILIDPTQKAPADNKPRHSY